MATRPVPERARWAVRTLAVGPDDQLLEIGCGRGTLVSLLCEQLTGGRITALDRSATMIRQAGQRNAAQVAAGRIEFLLTEFAEAPLPDGHFDKVFAVNVNLFWVRPAGPDLALVRRVLRPGGGLYLFYELPVAARAEAIVRRLGTVLPAHGFEITGGDSRSYRGRALRSVQATPTPDPAA